MLPQAALAGLVCLAACAAPPPGKPAAQDGPAFFRTRVRPILAARCWKCHTGERAGGGLDLHSRAALLKGGSLGPAVVPGKPEQSLLIQAVRRRGDLQMPPSGKLTPQQVKDLEEWVRLGAPVVGEGKPRRE